ncbi:MAG: radical SAM protein [Rhodospirillales bacterium]|nr:radical SAM protein [Rhodospirillales bacterium]
MPVPERLIVRQLDLELNGGCNLKCEMCPQAIGREKEFLKKLPSAVLEKILDDAIEVGVECVSLHGSGEPTLNKDMPNAVRAVKARGLKCVSFTNGVRLDEDMARRLIDAEIDVLRISAIGADPVSYKRWMSIDAFDDVRENVRRFAQLAKEAGGNTETHLYHLVTDNAAAAAETAAYQRNWIDPTGAFGEIWMMHNWSGGFASPYARESLAEAPIKRSCGRPFSELLQVRAGGLDGHTGGVVACCMVLGKDSTAVLGHLDDQTIAEVVAGDAYENLRAAHREGRFDDIPYCKDCDQLYDFPDALVWSNIPGRAYGQSKIVGGLDHRTYAET